MRLDRSIFTISDLHLGHRNIIRYCRRPFSCVDEMDQALIRAWNRTITPLDTVIFCGDLSLSRQGHPREYLRRLNGTKVMVRGNHDRQLCGPIDGLHLHYADLELFFVHRPDSNAIPADFDGWIVHGHVHDNAPFFCPETRRINVSCEVIGYRPVSLLWLYSLIKSENRTLSMISEFSQDETYRHIQDIMPSCVQIA